MFGNQVAIDSFFQHQSDKGMSEYMGADCFSFDIYFFQGLVYLARVNRVVEFSSEQKQAVTIQVIFQHLFLIMKDLLLY